MKLSLNTLFQKLVRRVLAETYDRLDRVAISQPGRVNLINRNLKKKKNGESSAGGQILGRWDDGHWGVVGHEGDGKAGICSHQRWSGGATGKESAFTAGDTGDLGSIPGSGRPPGGGHSNPLWYPCLENPMDGGAWRATIHRVAKSQTRLKGQSTHGSEVLGSVQFSCSVVSNSSQPHESQHARPPCPSPTPGVHPDSRPSIQ